VGVVLDGSIGATVLLLDPWLGIGTRDGPCSDQDTLSGQRIGSDSVCVVLLWQPWPFRRLVLYIFIVMCLFCDEFRSEHGNANLLRPLSEPEWLTGFRCSENKAIRCTV
jgi:hypothetical protein